MRFKLKANIILVGFVFCICIISNNCIKGFSLFSLTLEADCNPIQNMKETQVMVQQSLLDMGCLFCHLSCCVSTHQKICHTLYSYSTQT